MSKFIKYVDYGKDHKHGQRTLHPIVTIRVQGYNRMLNPPKPQVKADVELGMKDVKFGF